MEIRIELVEHLSVAEIEPLVIESEHEGWRFLRRLLDEWLTGQNRFDRPGERLLSARSAGQLIGICGLNIDPNETDGRIGRVRRLDRSVESAASLPARPLAHPAPPPIRRYERATPVSWCTWISRNWAAFVESPPHSRGSRPAQPGHRLGVPAHRHR
jgi:hypothetical protein